MVILTLLAYGLWKEKQKEEEAAKKEEEEILDNLESDGEEEEEKDEEIENIEKALAELKESGLDSVSTKEETTQVGKAEFFEDNSNKNNNNSSNNRGGEAESELLTEHLSPSTESELRKRGSIRSCSPTKPLSRSHTRSRSRGRSAARERSRSGRKRSNEGRLAGGDVGRSKIEMVKLKIEARIRREEEKRRARDHEFQQSRHTSHHHHHHHLENQHHRHFPNVDHYTRYDDDEYYGPPGPAPSPFHGDYGPPPPQGHYPRQHGKTYPHGRPGGGYHHEKGFYSKSFYPPPPPPPVHMHYQRFPPQY